DLNRNWGHQWGCCGGSSGSSSSDTYRGSVPVSLRCTGSTKSQSSELTESNRDLFMSRNETPRVLHISSTRCACSV
ncbi:M14 family zinc carboxypeptidase, partial [Streptosporangium sp. NPDC001682]